ncbi:MAG: vanadium-dependent haloperoxidase [Saprospiraceae bacterium]|nr:vanadium-dependent haloperoxidase [Saprospiraceae bacterium]
MKFKGLFLPILALIVILGGSSCKKKTTPESFLEVKEFSAATTLKWHQKFLEIERYADGMRPIPAPRALAYIGLAAYEVCIPGMPAYNSFKGKYYGLNLPTAESGKAIHWPSALNACYKDLYLKFLTDNKQTPEGLVALKMPFSQYINEFAATQEETNKAEVNNDEVYNRSVKWGKDVAAAVWAWSETDAFGVKAQNSPFDPSHVMPTGIDKWVKTNDNGQYPMFPFGGRVRTFAISESDKLCPPPLAWSTDQRSQLYAQAMEVYAANTPKLSYEDQWIAEFWSDDLVNLTFSPPPRLIAVALQFIEKQNSSLEEAIYTCAKLGMALNDAGVACWHSKFYYNILRPEQYIKAYIDPTWEPHLTNPYNGQNGITPNFPAFPSGHSTFAGAGADILENIFGNNFEIFDQCHANQTLFNGTPRFITPDIMKVEDATSRIPLGVHFRMDCEKGIALGEKVARRVNAIKWKK